MRKTIILLSILILVLFFILTFSLNVGAIVDKTACKAFGFDSGIGVWKWKNNKWVFKKWVFKKGSMGTSVNGTNTNAHWNVGTSNATGIIVLGRKIEYAVNGTNGTEHQNLIRGKALKKITFCKGSIAPPIGCPPFCG